MSSSPPNTPSRTVERVVAVVFCVFLLIPNVSLVPVIVKGEALLSSLSYGTISVDVGSLGSLLISGLIVGAWTIGAA